MRPGETHPRLRCWRQGAGFTLIEVIGVLAILAIVAGTFAPSLARRISRARGDKEDEVLKVLADGYVRAVRAYQRIPGPSSWVADVAAQTGLSQSEVLQVDPTLGSNARVLLIHPSIQPSTSAASDPVWIQDDDGTETVAEVRILMISSHKGSLALPVSSGRATSASAFNAVWDWYFNPSTRAPPSGWPATWTGNGEYLHVRRINLMSEFHRATFSNEHFPDATPSLQVGASSLVPLDDNATEDAWFLHGTGFRLYKDADEGGDLDSSHTLVGPMNFVYADHRWIIP